MSKMKHLFLLLTLMMPFTASAQSNSDTSWPTAMEMAAEMYPGWNLGNTLEPGPCDSVNWPYTGISYVVRDTFDTDVPYDLQGRPLNNNSVKGVYILNGKKYIR